MGFRRVFSPTTVCIRLISFSFSFSVGRVRWIFFFFFFFEETDMKIGIYRDIYGKYVQ